MSLLGAVLLIVLVVVLFAVDWWSNRMLRKLGAEPRRSAPALRVVNVIALIAVLAYAIYVVLTR